VPFSGFLTLFIFPLLHYEAMPPNPAQGAHKHPIVPCIQPRWAIAEGSSRWEYDFNRPLRPLRFEGPRWPKTKPNSPANLDRGTRSPPKPPKPRSGPGPRKRRKPQGLRPQKRPTQYSIRILWAAASVLIPMGWNEFVSGQDLSPAVHVSLGWTFWLIPFIQGIVIAWRWSGEHGLNRLSRAAIGILLSSLFAAMLSRSVYNVTRPTFVYLVPTHELMDAERRAFFVRSSGPRRLHNVKVILRDNKSGQTHNEEYAERDPAPDHPLATPYFWFTPSSPWDEDYTVTSEEFSAEHKENLVLRSTKHTLQFAVEIYAAGSPNPVRSCRDPLLPPSYQLAPRSAESCDAMMTVPDALKANLKPAPYNMELPDGRFQILRMRTLNPPAGSESQSEERELSDWQKQKILPSIAPYHGKKLLILTASGKEASEYAKNFRDTFKLARWHVEGPESVPAGDEDIIDVQISACDPIAKAPRPELAAVIDALSNAAVKRRGGFVSDADVPADLIVLWVGWKSPDGISVQQCTPPSFKPREGERQPCELVLQNLRPIPIPPP
jgi:hypothetical protein